MKKLYEILLPLTFNSGKKISKDHHQQFYTYVLNFSSGLTISKPLKGYWYNNKKLETEDVIFIRFTSTESEMLDIANFAKKHYLQKAIMCYRLSEDVHFII